MTWPGFTVFPDSSAHRSMIHLALEMLKLQGSIQPESRIMVFTDDIHVGLDLMVSVDDDLNVIRDHYSDSAVAMERQV